MKKRMIIMLIVVTMVFGAVVAWYFVKQAMIAKFMSKFSPPPATVTTTTVQAADWQPTLTAIGSLTAKNSVNLTPEIAGVVTHIYFTSGQMVQAGQPLVDLDTANQIAQLKADVAQLELAKSDYQRNLALYKRHNLSQADLQTSLSKWQGADASVEGDIATLKKMHIVAPFSGKIGISTLSVGQYIAPGGNSVIATLNSVDPILLDFMLSQQNLSQLYVGQTVQFTVDAYPGKTFTGKVTAIDSDVSENSRMVKVEAEVPNTDQKLLPGMFVNINVLLPIKKQVLTIPQTAVAYSLYGDSVFVVNKDDTVTQRFVTLGATQGINIAVDKGLQMGDIIVSSGQLKLQNGNKIVVNNSVQPN